MKRMSFILLSMNAPWSVAQSSLWIDRSTVQTAIAESEGLNNLKFKKRSKGNQGFQII